MIYRLEVAASRGRAAQGAQVGEKGFFYAMPSEGVPLTPSRVPWGGTGRWREADPLALLRTQPTGGPDPGCSPRARPRRLLAPPGPPCDEAHVRLGSGSGPQSPQPHRAHSPRLPRTSEHRRARSPFISRTPQLRHPHNPRVTLTHT